MNATTRVLIVDDQALVRTGIRLMVAAEPTFTVVGEAEDGAAAVYQVELTQPDVVLMDVRMPRVNGIAATASIVARWPHIRIIALTTFDLDEYAFSALRAGASGFLLKDARPEELHAAIRAVAAGEAALSPRITLRMLELFGNRLPQEADATAGLTPRERDILMAIGEGLANQEIAQRLFLTESTVKTHVTHVLRKLGLRDRVQAVIYAHQQGLV